MGLSASVKLLMITDFVLFISMYIFGLILLDCSFNSNFCFIAVITSLCWLYILFLKGYYKVKNYDFKWRDSYHIFESIIVGIFISSIILFSTGTYRLSYTLVATIFIYPLLLGSRYLFNAYIKYFKKDKNVLIVGAGNAGKAIADLIQKYPKLKYKISGFVDDDPEKLRLEIAGIKVLGTTKEIKNIVKDNSIKIIVIAINKLVQTESMNNISECAGRDITFFNMPDMFEYITSKVPVKHITPDWFIYNLTRIERPFYRFSKRIFDIIGAIIIIIATLPAMTILMLSIKLADGGKIFYTQERVGKHGKLFKMLKFRTMIEKAEENGAVWASNNNMDPRVTTIGRVARKLRFDELPQMINILKGDMCLVGPRPERPEFTSLLEKQIPFYHRRHWITPGWTGWAQIMYKYGASVDDATEKLRYDLYYIKNRNLFFDFSILIKAVGMALSGRHG